MNSNQIKENSIIENEALRREIVTKIFDVINKKLAEQGKEKLSNEIMEEFLEKGTNKHIAAKNYIDNKTKAMTDFSEHKSKGLIDGSTRSGIHFVKQDLTDDDYVYNQQLRDMYTNPFTRAYLANKNILLALNNKTENIMMNFSLESLNKFIENSQPTFMGMLITNNDLLLDIGNNNPELANLAEYGQLLYQTNPGQTLSDHYSNPLSMLIPDDYIDCMTTVELSGEFDEIIEEYNNSNPIEEFKNFDKSLNTTINNYANNTITKNNLVLDSEYNSTMNNSINKGFFINYNIMQNKFIKKDELGNITIPSLKDVAENMDPTTGKLMNGYEMVEQDKNLLKTIEANSKCIEFNSNFAILNNILHDETSISTDNYIQLKEEIANYIEDISTNVYGRDFVEEYNSLTPEEPARIQGVVDRANSGNIKNAIIDYVNNPDKKKTMDELMSKVEAYKKDTIITTKYSKEFETGKDTFDRNQYTKAKYSDIDATTRNMVSSIKDSKNLETKDINKIILAIRNINKKDERFNNKNVFHRMWYKNTHNALMQTKNELKALLEENNINVNNIDDIGTSREKGNDFSACTKAMRQVKHAKENKVVNVEGESLTDKLRKSTSIERTDSLSKKHDTNELKKNDLGVNK